jgi:acetyl-CoA carboxylase alpha subunit
VISWKTTAASRGNVRANADACRETSILSGESAAGSQHYDIPAAIRVAVATVMKRRHFVHGHDKVRAPDKNIENNPMQSRMRSLARTICPRKHFDTSGKSPAHFQYRAI